MAVVTPGLLAACSSRSADVAGAAASSPSPAASSSVGPAPEANGAPAVSDLVWARADLGFVSAYVLARGNSATIVDTGSAGSAAAIGRTLADLGLNYSDVAHVILTHNHPDHAGSINEVLLEAINATAYAGEADLGSLPRDLVGLVGGEDIFGCEMVPTPGHTPGHMAVIDHQAGLLVAGDALFSENGGVVEGPPRFYDDIAQSRVSIAAMAALTFNTLLVGHGDPILDRADTAVGALAASFG